MRYLTLKETLEIHRRVVEQSGGATEVRDVGALASSLAQPQMTFGGDELYPTIVDKASALGFSLIKNHPFIDGNKRVGHAALEIFLLLNGFEVEADTDEQEKIILLLANGELSRESFTNWLRTHVVEKAE